MGTYIKITGLDALQYELKLRTRTDLVKEVVKKNGQWLENRMVRNADFTQGYQTGTTKRSIPINTVYKDNGLTVEVGPGTEYSMYLEYGTRFMAAQPFIGPAYRAYYPVFMRQLRKVME